jgi:hypothetical protein
MNKEFLPYEQALSLKELGFDKPCLAWFSDRNIRIVGVNGCALLSLPVNSNFNGDDEFVTAPTYSQAFRFFREKQYFSEILIECDQHDASIGYSWWIWKLNEIEEYSPDKKGFEWSYNSYEKAELECLKRLIEIVKDKIKDKV